MGIMNFLQAAWIAAAIFLLISGIKTLCRKKLNT